MTAPRATMRLQFHCGFTFEDATAIVPYLANLGISHIYASPIMTARAGSLHGYDVIDPASVNPELGGESAFRNLVATLKRAGLGIIVDVVPNHMAVGSDNPWWLDVLKNGRQSRFAHFFDIDWETDDPLVRDKVLLPVLGRPYDEALRHGEIALTFDDGLGCYAARYFQHVFPIASAHAAEIERETRAAYDAANAEGRARLHALLERQNFRLCWWRIANDAINWRRFFDINELAGLRMEDDDVFETVHAKLFALCAEGLIDGVRIDHIDGLADPGAYCRRLRTRLEGLRGTNTRDRPYIIVEKILGANEQLPEDWDCDGTSGYDFMDQVSRVLHDPLEQAPLSELWASVSGRPATFDAEEQESRREILQRSFSAQCDSLVRAVLRLAQSDLKTRDMAAPAIHRALTEILVHMRVYRTYVTPGHVSQSDREHLMRARDAALDTCFRADRLVVDQLAAWFCGDTSGETQQHLTAMRKFQQMSAPLAAKAVEDTAFYRHGVLLSRLEVGFDPSHIAGDLAEFHQETAQRAEHFPNAMLASVTHDHKRGEDVRARLAVLSEIPEEWDSTLREWLADAQPLFKTVNGARAPSQGDAAILFQMIVGAWPPDLTPEDAQECAAFSERLAGWQEKALREAKLATEWTVPNEAYEAAARDFLKGLFALEWRRRIASFAHRIAPAGALNGLTQTLLKLTLPGVPDFYQGTDFWDFSLVDPDNRRPVDFTARRKSLSQCESVSELANTWRDGHIKQALIRDALAARRSMPELFAKGDYQPLDVHGPGANHLIAFLRRHAGAVALVVAGRLAMRWLEAGQISPSQALWQDTDLVLPDAIATMRFRDVFDGRELGDMGRAVPVSHVLRGLPVALLMSSAPV